jgi:hypothetical protein
MTNGSVAEAALVSLQASQSAQGAQPTAQQTARFEQLLQSPASAGASQYAIPQTETAVAGNWHLVMNDLGHMAEQFRSDAAALEGAKGDLDSTSGNPRQASDPRAAANGFLKGMAQLSHMSYTMMNISFITTTERLAGENVRSLYQIG